MSDNISFHTSIAFQNLGQAADHAENEARLRSRAGEGTAETRVAFDRAAVAQSARVINGLGMALLHVIRALMIAREEVQAPACGEPGCCSHAIAMAKMSVFALSSCRRSIEELLDGRAIQAEAIRNAAAPLGM
jgi:hypothetical protein